MITAIVSIYLPNQGNEQNSQIEHRCNVEVPIEIDIPSNELCKVTGLTREEIIDNRIQKDVMKLIKYDVIGYSNIIK